MLDYASLHAKNKKKKAFKKNKRRNKIPSNSGQGNLDSEVLNSK